MTDAPGLTELDRRVLNEVQASFPISWAPYCDLASKLADSGFETSEVDVLDSVLKLRAGGVIRRIGAMFDSHRLGYRSTLCAIAVPEERVDEVAELISGYGNVTHNYLRKDHYNMWFTLIAASRERINAILDEIARETGIDDILDLPATRLFKIRVDFDLTGERRVCGNTEAFPAIKPAETAVIVLAEDEKELARLLQEDLPTGEHPFDELHEQLEFRGVDETREWVLDTTKAWVESGVIRRFGAAIRHHKTGFSANAMGVWDCPDERIEQVGCMMAAFDEVSHCYERPRLPQWPANLYTMIHGRSEDEVEEVARRIQEAVGLPGPRLLYSTREFKKSSMRYFSEEEYAAGR